MHGRLRSFEVWGWSYGKKETPTEVMDNIKEDKGLRMLRLRVTNERATSRGTPPEDQKSRENGNMYTYNGTDAWRAQEKAMRRRADN